MRRVLSALPYNNLKRKVMNGKPYIFALMILAGILSVGIGRVNARTAEKTAKQNSGNIAEKTKIYDEVFVFRNFRAKVKKDGRCGYVDNRGNEVVPLIYEDCYMDNDNRYLSVKINGKWGYRTVGGEEIIPCVYDEHFEFNPPNNYNNKNNFVELDRCFAAASLNGKWGAIDVNGKTVIPFIYRCCKRCKVASDLFVVSTEDRKYGILNVRGETVIPLSDYIIFTSGCYASQGVFEVAKYHETKIFRYMYGFRDAHNNEIVPCIYDRVWADEYGIYIQLDDEVEMLNFDGKKIFPEYKAKKANSNGILVERDGKMGMLDFAGREILPCEYKDVNIISNDETLLSVCMTDRWGLVDLSGKTVLPMEYERIECLEKGMFEVRKNGRRGVVNNDGKMIVPCEYDYIGDMYCRRGFLEVEKDGRCGIVDRKGRVVVPVEYEMCHNFTGNMTVVRFDGKYGFVNRSGKVVIPAEYDYVYYFRNGLAGVCRNGKWGYIDKKGKTVIPFEYDFAGSFSNGGIGDVKIGDVNVFIDKQGNPVFGYKCFGSLYPPSDVAVILPDEY